MKAGGRQQRAPGPPRPGRPQSARSCPPAGPVSGSGQMPGGLERSRSLLRYHPIWGDRCLERGQLASLLCKLLGMQIGCTWG